MVLLAATSGALDALGFLALGGVFASVMTGNLVLLGLSGGTRNGSLAAHAAVAVAGYVVGVAGGRPVTRAGGGRATAPPPAGPAGCPGRAVELGLVVAFAVGWELVRTQVLHPAQLVLVGLAAIAMGVQSAPIRASTGSTVSTTYLTGTLTGVVATVGAGVGRVRDEWGAVAVMAAALVGAAAAGVVLTERSSLAPLVPLVALVGVLVAARTLVRPASGRSRRAARRGDAGRVRRSAVRGPGRDPVGPQARRPRPAARSSQSPACRRDSSTSARMAGPAAPDAGYEPRNLTPASSAWRSPRQSATMASATWPSKSMMKQ